MDELKHIELGTLENGMIQILRFLFWILTKSVEGEIAFEIELTRENCSFTVEERHMITKEIGVIGEKQLGPAVQYAE